jgi:hypothetical protein
MTSLSEQIFFSLAKWENMARKTSQHNQKLLTAPRSYGKIFSDDEKIAIEMKKRSLCLTGGGGNFATS